MSTSTSAQNQKASKKNRHQPWTTQQQQKLWKVTQKVKVCRPGFQNFTYISQWIKCLKSNYVVAKQNEAEWIESLWSCKHFSGDSSGFCLIFQCHIVICHHLVQSLNSPFFPPLTGAEPGRAKGESKITWMRMLRTPPFSRKSGEKPYLEVPSRFGLWRDFLNNNTGSTRSFWVGRE